jgi:hypothetical protein
MLARAYGVPRDLSAVSATIYERIFGPMEITLSVSTLDEIPSEWNAIQTIVGILSSEAEAFVERVMGEIASTLASGRSV